MGVQNEGCMVCTVYGVGGSGGAWCVWGRGVGGCMVCRGSGGGGHAWCVGVQNEGCMVCRGSGGVGGCMVCRARFVYVLFISRG